MQTVIQSEFKFRNVGQGLFYTGRIKDFTFVYDCGSDSGGKLLNEAISEFRSEYNSDLSKKIDLNMLVISHFDRDHVNGLGKLLENFQVDTVVIPYLFPLERLRVASENLNSPDEYFDLLKDPIAYFASYKVKQIILMSAKSAEDDNTSEPIFNDDRQFDYDLIEAFSELPDNKIFREVISEIEDLENIPSDIKIGIKKNGNVRIGYMWEFSFFTYDSTVEVIEEFCKISKIGGKSILDQKQLTEILSSKDRAKIKKSYQEIIDKIKSKFNIKDINNTSIVLSHVPINAEWNLTESMLIRKKKEEEIINKFKIPLIKINNKRRQNIRLYKVFRESDYFRWYSRSRNEGTLLFGDIDVRIDIRQIQNFFGDRLKNISIVLIPHHGSINNWDIRLFSILNRSTFGPYFSSNLIWVISFGFGNKHGHPHPEILQQLTQLYPETALFLNNEMMEVNILKTVIWSR